MIVNLDNWFGMDVLVHHSESPFLIGFVIFLVDWDRFSIWCIENEVIGEFYGTLCQIVTCKTNKCVTFRNGLRNCPLDTFLRLFPKVKIVKSVSTAT